jgi:DNA-binding transcriptional MerR regulator
MTGPARRRSVGATTSGRGRPPAPAAAAAAGVAGDGVPLGIGRAAEACGVSERALRYYQELGLLTPSGRTPGGMRRYSPDDLARVRRIRELQSLLGLNLDEIRVVLDNDDRLAKVREEYRSTRTGAGRRRELLHECLAIHESMAATVERKIADLQQFRTEVGGSVERVKALIAELESQKAAGATG